MVVALIFSLLTLVPPFVVMAARQDSQTPGLLMATIVAIVALVRFMPRMFVPSRWILALTPLLVLMLLPLLRVQGALAFRVAASALMFVFFVAFGALLGTALADTPYNDLARGLKLAFVILVVLGWTSFVFSVESFGYGNQRKPVFPFTEPSHFAMVAGPIYCAMLVVLPPRWRKYVWLNAALQAALMPTLSMLLFALLMILLATRFRILLPTFAVGLFALLGYGVFSADSADGADPTQIGTFYFVSRLNTSSESTNLSTLTFLQGWNDAFRLAIETNGVGWGFQMLGTQSPNIYAKRVAELTGDPRLEPFSGGDGGAGLAAKIIAELGVIGLIICILIALRMIRSLYWLRRALLSRRGRAFRLSDLERKLAIAHVFIVAFAVEFVLRNLGYFSPAVIFYVAALLFVQTITARRVRAAGTRKNRGSALKLQGQHA